MGKQKDILTRYTTKCMFTIYVVRFLGREKEMDVGINDINRMKRIVTEQFSDELPVLCAKAKVSQENIA